MNISKSNHQFCMVILTWEALLPCTSRILHSALVGLPHGSQLHRLNLSLFIFLHVLGGCGKKTLIQLGDRRGRKSLSSSDPQPETLFRHSFWHAIWKYTWHIFILALHLTFFLAYTLTFYLAFCLAYFLTYFLAYVLTFILAFFLASILTFSSTFNFGILFGIYSDIGICIHVHSNPKKDRTAICHQFSRILPISIVFLGAGPRGPPAKAQSGCSCLAPRGSKAADRGDRGGTVPVFAQLGLK